MIDFVNVSKRFGRARVLSGVNLRIAPGGSVALWGTNGAGKTTLLRCLLGLYRFDGRITLAGHDVIRDGKRARAAVGYVPQELGFYDDLRVDQALRFFASLKGVGTPPAAELLDRVGLPGQGAKRVRELSGGMKQRLALAIAMLGEPPVLVRDEVTASLDACGRAEFVDLLARLAGSGRTMLFASHRVEEIAALARTVVTLERGVVQSVQETAEFLARQGEAKSLRLADGFPAQKHAHEVRAEPVHVNGALACAAGGAL